MCLELKWERQDYSRITLLYSKLIIIKKSNSKERGAFFRHFLVLGDHHYACAQKSSTFSIFFQSFTKLRLYD